MVVHAFKPSYVGGRDFLLYMKTKLKTNKQKDWGAWLKI
jgi:hypothetical protein